MTQYMAHAIGNGAEGAASVLQEKYNKSMSLREAQVLVLQVLKDTMEEKIGTSNVELATIAPGTGYKLHDAASLEELIKETTDALAAAGDAAAE